MQEHKPAGRPSAASRATHDAAACRKEGGSLRSLWTRECVRSRVDVPRNAERRRVKSGATKSWQALFEHSPLVTSHIRLAFIMKLLLFVALFGCILAACKLEMRTRRSSRRKTFSARHRWHRQARLFAGAQAPRDARKTLAVRRPQE